MPTPYELWLADKKKREQAEKQGKINFKEASQASRPQYTLPQYKGRSENKKITYQWESDLLKPMRGMGRSYNDKYSNWAKSQGLSRTEAEEYRRSQDFEEDRKQTYKLNDDGTPNNRQNVRAGQGAMLQSEVMDGIFKSMNQRVSKSFQESKMKEAAKENAAKQKEEKTAKIKVAKKQREENPTILDNLKNFLTGKDTDKDGQRNGLLGALDRFVLPISQGADEFLMPGNNERMVQNDILKHGKVTNPVNKASLVDRGTETKVLHGAGTLLAALAPYGEAYKAADYGFNKLPKLANAVTNPYTQRAIKGAAAGGMAEAGLSAENELANSEANSMKDYAIRTGLGVAGGAILDPALYGVGQGLKKGVESTVNNTMTKILPDKKEAATRLSQLIKEYHSEQAPLPGKPDLRGAKELIPSGNSITDPNFVPSLKPKANTDPVVPKIGNRLENIPPIEDLSLAERTQLVEGNRPTPDFSTAKPVIEPADNVNVYGVEAPKGDLMDTAPPEYWQKRYEDFTKYVKDNGYNENNLNHEAIQELWTHFAKADEPPLNTVVDLAYKGYKEPKVINTAEVWDQMGNRPPVSKNAKDILLGNSKTKSKSLPPTPEVKPIQEQPQPNLLETLKSLGVSDKPNEMQMGSNTDVISAEQVMNKKKTSDIPPSKSNERSFYNTVQNPEKLSPELEQRLAEFDKSYTPMSNEETVKFANKYVKKDMEKAYQFVKNAKKFDPRHVTVGHRLIDELQKAGQYDRALDVVERLADQGTKAGQSIQSYSIYNRLSAEGQLLRAQRRVNKINETILDPNKQVKLTEQTIQDITHSADSIKKFTGQEEQANNVIKIMDSIKKGKIATDAELDIVRSFVSDAKKFVGDLDPAAKPPKVKSVKDVRTRDKVVNFMDKKEELSRQELKKIFSRANSMPVDAFYHLSTIGASKVAKGTVKLADFTEEMVKDFGEIVRPYAKQIYNKAVETFNLQSESMTRQRLSEVEKITNKALKDKNLSTDEADSIREFARQVGLMSGDAKLESSMELQTVLQALERPTFGQKLSAAQTIAQLLNPKTIVRNAIGNEMFYRVEQINKLVATPVDILRSKITGGERTITFRTHNQGQYWRNWLTGAKAGWKSVNPLGLQTAYDLGPQAFRSKFNPLTYMEKALGATLRSFDHAGYMRAYNKTLGEMATLRATNEGLKGTAKKEAISQYIREADANMIQLADQYGKYATFQDNTVISKALTKVKKGMNKVSTLGATEDFGLGDLVLKYPKTPGNLVMRALEYSPAGVVRSASLLKSMRVTKNPAETREFWLSLTRSITGTGGFSLLGYALADKGILTSAGNSDFEVASLERNAGKQPNSVNVSALGRFISSGFNLDKTGTKEGDTFISYDWAQPISIAVALGTGVSQSVKENGELSATGAMTGGFDSAANTVINQSVLKGLNDFLANYPGRTMSDRVGDAAKGIAGSFIPTLSNQARQLGDNTARTTYSPGLLPEIKNRAINRVPGLEKLLPPAYDTLGNQRETYRDKGNNLFNVLLNPAFVSKYNPSSEAKFVLDMINETGDKSLAPRLAQKKLDGKPLTSKQYSEMQRIMGEEAQSGLSEVYANGPSDQEAIRKAIEKVLREAGKKGREAIRAERGE
jgi:hypothetical protein